MASVEIAPGFHAPFFPMRPTPGRDLRTKRCISALWAEIEDEVWLAQPKLDGDRAYLFVYKRRVHVHNRHGRCYRMRVANAADYLRLPDGSCFDGEIFKGNFYPFEALAIAGRSLLSATTVERVKLARDHAEFLKHAWLFPEPNFGWLLRRNANLPLYQGVVLKKNASAYRLLGSASQTSLDWFKRCW